MNLPVILSPAADREFDEAATWYEQRAGLGERFVERVQEALDRIGQAPELHSAIYQDVRRVRVQRFPYGVFYRILGDRIEVSAVFHDRIGQHAVRPEGDVVTDSAAAHLATRADNALRADDGGAFEDGPGVDDGVVGEGEQVAVDASSQG